MTRASFPVPGCVHSGPPRIPVNGPWLDGSFQHHRNLPYKRFAKCGRPVLRRRRIYGCCWMRTPTGLNDAAFAFQMDRSRLVDVPGTYTISVAVSPSRTGTRRHTAGFIACPSNAALRPIPATSPIGNGWRRAHLGQEQLDRVRHAHSKNAARTCGAAFWPRYEKCRDVCNADGWRVSDPDPNRRHF